MAPWPCLEQQAALRFFVAEKKRIANRGGLNKKGQRGAESWEEVLGD